MVRRFGAVTVTNYGPDIHNMSKLHSSGYAIGSVPHFPHLAPTAPQQGWSNRDSPYIDLLIYIDLHFANRDSPYSSGFSHRGAERDLKRRETTNELDTSFEGAECKENPEEIMSEENRV